MVTVAKATHRPISIPFVRLLGHAVSKHWKGRKEDGWTFWTICKIAFWGSFRVGELLTEGATTYSPKSDFLGSDLLWMSETSLALWIRDPKISKEYGDVIEIWKTQQFPDLDPWSTFRPMVNIPKLLGKTSIYESIFDFATIPASRWPFFLSQIF